MSCKLSCQLPIWQKRHKPHRKLYPLYLLSPRPKGVSTSLPCCVRLWHPQSKTGPVAILVFASSARAFRTKLACHFRGKKLAVNRLKENVALNSNHRIQWKLKVENNWWTNMFILNAHLAMRSKSCHGLRGDHVFVHVCCFESPWQLKMLVENSGTLNGKNNVRLQDGSFRSHHLVLSRTWINW